MAHKRKKPIQRTFRGKRYELHGEYWTKDTAEAKHTPHPSYFGGDD